PWSPSRSSGGAIRSRAPWMFPRDRFSCPATWPSTPPNSPSPSNTFFVMGHLHSVVCPRAKKAQLVNRARQWVKFSRTAVVSYQNFVEITRKLWVCQNSHKKCFSFKKSECIIQIESHYGISFYNLRGVFTMSIKVGINGFGRIGRMVFRASINHPDIEIVGINDLCPADYLAYMLKYDTMLGQFKGEVSSTENAIVVNGKEIPIFAERNPADLPWGKIGAEYVVES